MYSTSDKIKTKSEISVRTFEIHIISYASRVATQKPRRLHDTHKKKTG